MKNCVVLLMALALIGSATAADYGFNLVGGVPYEFPTDGDLTNLTPDIWGTWGDNADGAGPAVVSGGQCTIGPNTGTYEIAFSHDNAVEDLGITPDSDKIELVVNVVSISAGANAIVKIEQHPLTNSFPNPDNGTGASLVEAWDPDTTITGPGEYSFVSAAACLADTAAITPVIGVGTTGGTLVIDSIWVGPEGTYTGGSKPNTPDPENNAIVAVGDVTDLSWVNPAPIVETDDLSVSVRLGVGPYDSNWPSPATAVGTNLETISIAAMTNPVTTPLTDDTSYYWQVTITDPNTGGTPRITEGNIWTFDVGDAPPAVNAGPDAFMWLAQDDSALDPAVPQDENIRYFQVVGTYTDDGKSVITDANFVNLGWDYANGDLGVLEVSDNWVEAGDKLSGTVTAVYRTVYNEGVGSDESTVIPGYWDLQLEVSDQNGARTAIDVTYQRIDETCALAAAADASDTFDTTYDSDGNCKNDLVDFAAFAAKWLDQSVKFE